MSHTIQAVRGMNDILPDEAVLWEELEETLRSWLRSYGYRNLRTPLVEPTALFRRAIGEATDIVEKEMYSFVDELNGEALTLRPEATASTVRSAIQHNLLYGSPRRLYYLGPMYRHERPQKGRHRQFHQVGAEALGYAGPDVDAELLLMCARLWDDLGLDDIKLQLNCIGSPEERLRHRAELVQYLQAHADALDEDARRRLHTNPLRVLDSKNPLMQPLLEAAPRLLDQLGEASLAHFDGVQQVLKDVGIPYSINPRMVRGLDYYNLTVFEWVSERLGAQGTVCGGGRYDGLFEQIGGKPTPACGFAMGLERLLALMQEARAPQAAAQCEVYVVHQGSAADRMAFGVAEELRNHGLSVVQHCGGGNFKAQMKKADASGATLAVIIGEDEAASNEVSVKHLRQEREQVRVARTALPDSVTNLLFLEDDPEGA
ncbi:MAG: histidine--tRNA ligase [Betaproteobacteria bacterium RIFCSPLOWO2_12_FULL_62_13b]|nr:MAG: histidine--tRNA ligase [Betaproteobacteria bacterium RIFCSPLOWO2_12_FULL_62_13b]